MAADDSDHKQRKDDAVSDQSQKAYRDAVGEQSKLPPLDFNTFILSLSTSALMQLGEVPDAGTQTHVDIDLARQTIDLIGVLEEKTKGNLTGEEERLLQQVLFDLRLCYVKKSKEKR